MSNSSVSKAELSKKTIHIVVIECVIISSFYVLFTLGMSPDTFGTLGTILLFVYPLGISICTGIVIATMTETKHLDRWKWGTAASAMTLLLMIMMLIFPSMWSGMAFIIAPVITIALFFVFLNSGETNNSQ